MQHNYLVINSLGRQIMLLYYNRYQDDQTYAQLLPLEDQDKARNNNPKNNTKITIEDLLQFSPKDIQVLIY